MNTAEAAFVDELEKIAGIGSGIRRGAKAFVESVKGGIREHRAGGLSKKIESMQKRLGLLKSEAEPKFKEKAKSFMNRHGKTIGYGAAAAATGAGVGYFANKD